MKDYKYKYKHYLRNQKTNSARCITESLSECLGNKNQTQFWKTWNAKFGSRNSQACSIDGLVNLVDIANKFADVLQLFLISPSIE